MAIQNSTYHEECILCLCFVPIMWEGDHVPFEVIHDVGVVRLVVESEHSRLTTHEIISEEFQPM